MQSGDDTPSIVISLRLSPEEAEAFRTEAARRNMRLNKLFTEMFDLYRSQPAKPAARKPK